MCRTLSNYLSNRVSIALGIPARTRTKTDSKRESTCKSKKLICRRVADVYNLNRIFTRTVLLAGWRLKAISYFLRAAKLRYTLRSHSAPSCCWPIERTRLINNENRCSQKETRSIELSKPSRGFVVRRCSHFRPNLATIENFCCLLQR